MDIKCKKIRWGIISTGAIANKFVNDLKLLKDAEVIAVASRSIEKAEEFGEKYGIHKRYGSYQELVQDSDVDVVYVSTPHFLHYENVLMCLNAGKAVLCEKAFTINAIQAKELIKLARAKKMFLMEAMWIRFLPIIEQVREWISKDVIGDILMITANFGTRVKWEPEERRLNRQLGGGAILDMGVYTISLISMIMGKKPVKIDTAAHIGVTGVDEQTVIMMSYNKGEIALAASAQRTQMGSEVKIMGTKGNIYIPDFIFGDKATLSLRGQEASVIERPRTSRGMQYEAYEVMNCICNRKTESDVMPLDETLSIMEIMDYARKQWGLKYPGEE